MSPVQGSKKDWASFGRKGNVKSLRSQELNPDFEAVTAPTTQLFDLTNESIENCNV